MRTRLVHHFWHGCGDGIHGASWDRQWSLQNGLQKGVLTTELSLVTCSRCLRKLWHRRERRHSSEDVRTFRAFEDQDGKSAFFRCPVCHEINRHAIAPGSTGKVIDQSGCACWKNGYWIRITQRDYVVQPTAKERKTLEKWRRVWA